MKTRNDKKSVWKKPEIKVLKIKKDTFSGSHLGSENPQQPGHTKPH